VTVENQLLVVGVPCCSVSGRGDEASTAPASYRLDVVCPGDLPPTHRGQPGRRNGESDVGVERRVVPRYVRHGRPRQLARTDDIIRGDVLLVAGRPVTASAPIRIPEAHIRDALRRLVEIQPVPARRGTGWNAIRA
jgi:hypothetical protein